MKNFMRLLLMGLVISTFVSCGKDNETSGKSKSKKEEVETVINSTGSNFANYNEMKNAFTGMSMSSGLSNNDVIYHVGPDFTDEDTSGGGGFFEIGFQGCIDLIFWSAGDCDYDPSSAQMQNIVDSGSYKVVKAVRSDSVDFDLASGVTNFLFDFEFGLYDRSADIYKAMLNLDNKPTRKVVLSKATVTLVNGGNVKADFVEYFYDDGTIKGFVLSNALPLMANPIANTQGSYQGYMASPQVMTGALNFAANKTIRSIRVDTHLLDYDVQTNKYTARVVGPLSVNFN